MVIWYEILIGARLHTGERMGRHAPIPWTNLLQEFCPDGWDATPINLRSADSNTPGTGLPVSALQ
jgi:hypothetical protein